MELTSNDENQVKAGPDRDKEKKQTRWASSIDALPNCVRYRLTCFYYACAILASELGKLWEPIIYRKSDQIIPFWIWAFVRKGQPFWLQTKLILHHLGHLQQQLVSLRIWISRYLLTHLWIEIPRALISWIWYHVEGVIIRAIMIALWNLNLLGPLLACCLKSLIIDIRIYISTDPLN